MERIRIRRLVMTGAMAAVLCVLGPWSIPVGPVPISICSLLVGLCACVGGGRQAAAAVAVYLLVCAAGLPVFSGFAGGAAALLGPTGGYLAGYLPLTALTGLRRDSRTGLAVGYVLGTAVLYLCGMGWYCLQTAVAVRQALAVCVLPFLPGDGAKLAALLTVGPAVRSRLLRAGLL